MDRARAGVPALVAVPADGRADRGGAVEMAEPMTRRPADTGRIVLSLCDLTGNMVRPWAEAGWVCICVDIQHSIRAPRYEAVGDGAISFVWGDVRSWTPSARPAIIFGFPPCTDLAVSGARDFERKAGYRLADALELFDACQLAGAYSGAPYMIENPVGRLNTHVRTPDFTFDPYEYGGYLDPPGDAYYKRTCLWTGNGFKVPLPRPVRPTEGSKMHLMAPGEDRANLRSETPMGFAQAVFEANAPALEAVAV